MHTQVPLNIRRSVRNFPGREVTHFFHFTGFKSHETFKVVLESVQLHSNRPYVVNL